MLLFILLTIVSFLRVLFIIILVWYAFKVAMRFLAPRVVEKAAEKIVRDMQQQQQNQNLGGMIQSDNMRRCGNPTSCRVQENAAAQQRAWEARERQIQKEIAELRRTPFYQAIAYDLKTERITWGVL